MIKDSTAYVGYHRPDVVKARTAVDGPVRPPRSTPRPPWWLATIRRLRSSNLPSITDES